MKILVVVLTITNLIAILNIRSRRKVSLRQPAYRQSTIHQMAKIIMPTNSQIRSGKPSQLNIYMKHKVIKVIAAPDGKTYWVKDNKFYVCDSVNGEFDPSQGKEIDTATLSKRELDRLLLILDNLNRGV
jgi:hypothetical protein